MEMSPFLMHAQGEYTSRYPKGPFLVIAALPENDMREIEQFLDHIRGQHRIFFQSVSIGWGLVLLSLQNYLHSDYSLHEQFRMKSFKARVGTEYERILKEIGCHYTVIPLQFPTTCDALFRTQSLLLREKTRFEAFYEILDNRLEYEISLTPFGPGEIANSNQLSAPKKAPERTAVIELCRKAFIPVMPWYMEEDSFELYADIRVGDPQPYHRFTALLNAHEYQEVTTRIHKLGAMVGVAGLAIKLSRPKQPQAIFVNANIQRNLNRYHTKQDNLRYQKRYQARAIA